MRTLFQYPTAILSRIIPILLLAGMSWSCNDASSELPEKPSMSFPDEPVLFSEAGGEQSITFTTNRPWTARLINNLSSTQGKPWCTLSEESGNAGRHQITIQAEALEGDYREAILILNASAAGGEILVMQSGQPVLTTAEASAVAESAATLGGSWIYSGEINIAEFGIGIREQSVAEYTYHAVDERAEDGSFSTRIEGLKSQTSYLFTVYVLTTDGIRYTGQEKSFTTDEPPVQISIAELKAIGRQVAEGGQQTLTESLMIEGTVIASWTPGPQTEPTPEEPGTKTRALVSTEAYITVVDSDEANSGITLYFSDPAENTFAPGDRLSVRTKDGIIRHAPSGLVDMHPLSIGISVLETGQEITPVAIDHTKLADYESMAVEIAQTQLTSLFTDTAIYPTWGSATLWNMEVLGSEISYSLYVPTGSDLAAQAPRTGSGTLYGIVIGGDNDDFVVRCDRPDDVAGLTSSRFESLLELRFLAPEFQGSLAVGEEVTGNLAIPYRNGDKSLLPGTIRAEITGDAAVIGSLSVESVSDVQLGAGSGSILLPVSGTPGAAGTITFTVYGLDALGSQNSCTAKVIVPDIPEVGNFEAVWDTATEKGTMQISGSSTHSSIAITNLILTASAENISGTKWADFAAIGWDINTSANKLTAPGQYYQTTLTVGSGRTLVLSGMDIEQRINGGDVTLSVQYALNAGSFSEIESILLTSDSEPFTVNLGKVTALKSLAEGTTVTIRLVPVATNAQTKWGIKKNSRFAIYGNAE